MATRKLAFIVRSLPYKTETSRLALTHAIASQSVEIYLEPGDMLDSVVAFIGDGVINCLRNQKAMEIYGVTSIEQHIKMALLLDLKLLICREDLETFGIAEDSLVIDAKDLTGETTAQIVSYKEIMKEMESSDHLLFF
jgi:tRNA 2-thiouridine synthesizing protein C